MCQVLSIWLGFSGHSLLSTTVVIEDSEMSKKLLQIEQKLVKNPNWWETDQLTICNACIGVNSGSTKHESI